MSRHSNNGSWHWLLERLTAFAMLPFSVWFLVCAIRYSNADRGAVLAWLGDPITSLAVGVMVMLAIYHAMLGLSGIVDDYVHSDANIWIKNSIMVFGIFLAIVSVISIISILLDI